MRRGELSNRPAAVFAFDYRLFVTQNKSYSILSKIIPEMLFKKSFERSMRKAFPWTPGSRLWLETHFDKRVAMFSVGVPAISRALDMIVGDFIADTHHFDNVQEFRKWLRMSKHIARVYTNDVELLSIDDNIQTMHGWPEDY